MKNILLTVIIIFISAGCSHRFEKRNNKNGIYLSGFENSSYNRDVIRKNDMKLTKVFFQEIQGWGSDYKKGSLQAFVRGCKKNRAVNIKEICEKGNSIYQNNPMDYEITEFFEKYFTPYKIRNLDKDSSKGLVTGYYVPFLNGSLTKTEKYKYPIYAKPRDFKNPYLSHKDIDRNEIDAEVICWVDDRVERFFLHIQGSGVVKLRDGSTIGVGYAEKNGYSYSSIGTYIHRRFNVPLYKLSANFIKNWVKKYPNRADEVLYSNKSFVFFRKQASNLAMGAMATNLVPKSTIAVDTKYIPLGIPIYIKRVQEDKQKVLNHLFMAQDRGGAIKGIIRADLFFGFGDEAGKGAGTMKQRAEFYMLIPNGYQF